MRHAGVRPAPGSGTTFRRRSSFRACGVGRTTHLSGNHEEDLKNYLAYFPMLGTNRWYSFDAGPVHVLALDYHFEKTTSAQFKFAREDLLKSTAPWKVVFVHNPVFNYGHHNSGWGHQSYLPLFREARVDLVLSGHSHMYERFRPVAPTNQPGAWAVTCITTAGGGAELHRPHTHPAQAVAISTNHFTLFDVTRETLRARAIRVDGVEIDAFEIRKPGGRQAAEYLAQVYPEEMLKPTSGPMLGRPRRRRNHGGAMLTRQHSKLT
ncbi:MAG: metallophosphoesterase [Verrucomicrobia bacterium]|nr:metallophosphoesterase [Verrucomicrobiota bacterium]